ncbi:neurotrypsin [Elysia marginata]|uniref:Neurotrypsin n=1 Tax=Elysia marginata TaxID=1093978 RepID=A0AAV4FT39_9GAST|nr:neurotrypsin [Elysia marginata]
MVSWARFACPYGWIEGAGQCYKLYTAAPGIKSATEVCARQNASLVNVHTWEQSDFLSKLLTSYPDIHEWHIGGRLRNGHWHWYTTAETHWPQGKRGKKKSRASTWRFLFKQTPVTENKWFPGWSSYDHMNAEPQEFKKRCMVLSNQFKAPGKGPQYTDYFYWKADWCTKKEGLNFVCQKEMNKEESKNDKQCKWGEFRCTNGQCIKGYHKCDLERHCDDNSDELDCPRSLQLVNGQVPYEGRVQMMMTGTDVFGSVCGTNFGDKEAQVICRALGFELGGEALKQGSYGYDRGLVWMDSLACNGHEKTLDECPYRDFESHTCDHSKDAAVRCFVPPDDIIVLEPVHLVGGPDGSMGKLVMEMYGENHRFCSDSLGETEANVICKELGYS